MATFGASHLSLRKACRCSSSPTSRPIAPQVRRVGRASAVPVSASAALPVHIVGISGSLRKASTNTGLLRAAGRLLPEGATYEVVDLDGIPHYNDDLWQGIADESVIPEAIRTFRAKVLKADAVLFATPEYNLGIPSSLKAALDWGSCGRGANVWSGKAALVVGAGGSGGTVRAQMQLRQVGVGLNLVFLNGPEVLLKRYEHPEYFNDDGDVVDAKVEGYIKTAVSSLVDLSRKLRS